MAAPEEEYDVLPEIVGMDPPVNGVQPAIVNADPAQHRLPHPPARRPDDAGAPAAPAGGVGAVQDVPAAPRPFGERVRQGLASGAGAVGRVSAHADGAVFADTPSAIYMKMMRQPLNVYNNGGAIEYDTDGVEGTMGMISTFCAMPAAWPDPLIADGISWKAAKAEDPERWWEDKEHPAHVVNVTEDNRYCEGQQLSALGMSLAEVNASPITDRTAQTSSNFHQDGGAQFGALSRLFGIWAKSGVHLSQDAAPSLRAGLLSMMFTDGNILAKSSQISQGLSFSSPSISYVEREVVTIDNLTNPLIPVAANTCQVAWITLAHYTSLTQGTVPLGNVSTHVTRKDLDTAVFVPIRAHDLHAAWLVLYAACFTTTYWWNGALRHKMNIPDSVEAMYVYASPLAAQVVVKGSYAKIVFVILDVITTPLDVVFGSWSGTTTGLCPDGAQEIYKALGMYADGVAPDSALLHELRYNMCRYVGTGDVNDRVAMMLAELCFTLPLGYGVMTGSSTNKKDRVFGMETARNESVEVAGQKVTAYTTYTDGGGKHFRFCRDWRVTPAGFLIYGELKYEVVKKNADKEQKTRATSLSIPAVKYEVTQLPHLQRMLVASDVFLDSSNCAEPGVSSALEYFRHKQYLASFVSLDMAWWYMESGLPIVDINGLGAFSRKPTLNQLRTVMTTMSLGFLRPSRGSIGRPLNKDWVVNVKKFTGLEAYGLDFCYFRSLHVPFWAVLAFMGKLMEEIPLMWETERFTVVSANSTLVTKLDYAVRVDEKVWYKLGALTSTLGYELTDSQQQKFFAIELANEGLTAAVPTITGWYPHVAIDSKVTRYSDDGENWDNNPDGLVELLAIVNPTHRVDSASTYMLTQTVGSRNRTGHKALKFRVTLNQPDPFLSWLGSKFMPIVPNLLAGDLFGASMSFATSVTNDLLSWAFLGKRAW